MEIFKAGLVCLTVLTHIRWMSCNFLDEVIIIFKRYNFKFLNNAKLQNKCYISVIRKRSPNLQRSSAAIVWNFVNLLDVGFDF